MRLVLTANEATWGASEPILFLGEWCKRYDRKEKWTRRTHKTVPFHWNNRKKLLEDYDYLESLHKFLVGALSLSLNDYHRVSYDERYWQILLDPWLMCYLGVIFDRWECLRYAYSEVKPNKLSVCMEEGSSLSAPNSYEDFIRKASSSELWNQLLYQRIINYLYLDRTVSIYCPNIFEMPITSRSLEESSFIRYISEYQLPKKTHQSILSWWASLNASPNIVFLGMEHTFIGSTGRVLNLALKQFPSRIRFFEYNRYRDIIPDNGITQVRSNFNLDWSASSDFEKFVKSVLVNDIPRCIVEDYTLLRGYADKLSIRPKFILTGSAHWTDPTARAWIAEATNRGTKLVILEHGGSLPPLKEGFNWEANIADVMVSWFKPFHRKHLQLPACKLVGRYGKFFWLRRKLSKRNYCSLIGGESPLWVLRLSTHPMAQQCLSSYDMALELYRGLKPDIKTSFKVKPYPVSRGWDTAKRFSDELGSNVLHADSSLDHVYAMSKLIVCTYPETTFAQAMASNVPTILIYPAQFYEINPVAHPLLNILKAAKIVFVKVEDAVVHLNSVWDNLHQWWDHPETLTAREEFQLQALALGPDSLSKWSKFLRSLARS